MSVFTTPNQTWIPEFGVVHGEITMFSDGRWGRHEYSRWPQAYARDSFHMACIPSAPHPDGPSSILWCTLSTDDWVTEDCGVAGMGRLKPSLMGELAKEASKSMDRLSHCSLRPPWDGIAKFLVICLRHCVDRLQLLPAYPGVIISLAAHIQRLCLELAGLYFMLRVVIRRLEALDDYSGDVLDVLSTHSPNLTVVQVLHCAGVPVWFQQPLTKQMAIYRVVQKTDVPLDFSNRPSYPRLWVRAMAAMVRRQLCASRLPDLRGGESEEGDRSARSGPPPKRFCVEKDTGSAGEEAQAFSKGFAMNPFCQHYFSDTVSISTPWSKALASVGALPQPSRSVTYFFPPPFLIDSLIGYESKPEKIARYIHHLVTVRTFCRLCLFDPTIAGKLLTVAEWRDALWGDYTMDGESEGSGGRVRTRHQLKQNLRQLFGGLASLPSYDSSATPALEDVAVTLHAVVADRTIQQRLVWEAHETNWRCELLALDAVMVGSNGWPELERWMRESLVSEIWGAGSSGVDIAPSLQTFGSRYCWLVPPRPGWENCRPRLQAFLDVLSRWPGYPSELRRARLPDNACTEEQYCRIADLTVAFYVKTFVTTFGRLPVPPVYVSGDSSA
ncbi:hypothetical protein C8Q78DRAFT_1071134 [Trametes maxima]|nr:hypothetical protein C8Q78DRAFT_1071134 [Trametes maxima]